MTIAHISDTHLGFRAYGRTTPQGMNQRETDVMRNFRACLNSIAERDPDLVVHSGDFFHVVRPSNATIVAAFQALTAFQQARKNKPFVLIGGNHDTPRVAESGNILPLFADIPGMRIQTSEAEAIDVPELDLEVLCVPSNSIRSGENIDYAPQLGRTHSVLLLHGMTREAVPQAPQLEVADTHHERWTYVAMGDYHEYQPYGANICYAGSTEFTSTNIWEEKKPKGWVYYDSDKTKQEFVAVPTRKVIDLPKIDALDLDATQLEEKIRANAKWTADDMPIVRQRVVNVLPEMRGQLGVKVQRDLNERCLVYMLNLIAPQMALIDGAYARPDSQTLEMSWQAHVANAILPGGVERDELQFLGLKLLTEVAERAADPVTA